MKNELLFPQVIYRRYLTFLNDISFTQREVDVMACLLHMRGTSKIASLLNIASTTVFTHIQHVMEKLNRHSREEIIDFIEKSHNLVIMKQYYACLVIHTTFEKSLRNSAKLTKNPLSPLIIYCEEKHCKEQFLQHLQSHLEQAGINAEIQHTPIYSKPNKIQSTKNVSIFVVDKEADADDLKKSADFYFLDVSQQRNYYCSVFEILKILYPHADFENVISEFTKVMDTMEGATYSPFSQSSFMEPMLEESRVRITSLPSDNMRYPSLKKLVYNRLTTVLFLFKKSIIFKFLLAFICLLGIFVFSITYNDERKLQPTGAEFPIRSDLIIPKESAFLSRFDLIKQMDDKFKKLKSIPTIALVGPGGAGKTTLARHYARQQNAPVVWEINAETKESLLMSFEELAFRLSQSPEDKDELKEIRETTNPVEKEKRLILLLKKQLVSHSNWFLIYDNLELFPNFLKYFPSDTREWGNGRVLITTRDSTLQNTSYVSLENVMPLGELKKQEGAELFIKILYGLQPLSETKKEKVLTFLQNIPSFPLDISVAAYYIKNAHITPEIYLERISQPCKKFEFVQEAIAKGVGEYAKTRYRVIALSLERLTNVDPDFADLCLFISLLDSQNIPREILNKYKSAVVVDSFVYNLSKYSLINPEAQNSPAPNISLHRSIQKIMLTYFSDAFGIKRTREKIQRMASQMETYADAITEDEDRLQARLLINHYEMFLSHTALLNHPVVLVINGELGNLYYCVKDFIKAEQFLEKATDASNKSYSLTRNIKFLLTLSKTYVQTDNTEKMRMLCERLLMVHQKFLPKNDITSALVLISLGNMYDSLAEFKTARQLVQEGLQIYRKHHPQGFFKEALLLGMLGNIYMKTGDYKEAKDFIEEGIAHHQKRFPEDHMRIAWLSICLGNAYIGLGNYDQAREVLERGVKQYTQHFSENHIATAWASVYLAHAYIKLKNYKKAQELLEKDLILYRKNFPPNHDGLIRAKTYLTDVYMGLEDYQKAKLLLEETLLGVSQRYGEQHLRYAQILQKLGKIYFLEGQTELATSTFHKALKIFLEHKNPEACICLENLADVFIAKASIALKAGAQQSQEFRKQAVDYLKRTLEMIKTHELDPASYTRLQDKLKKLE